MKRKIAYANERIGQLETNNYGSKMIVEEYNGHYDVWVRFIDTNERVHTRWQYFIDGKVRSAYDKTIFDTGFIGEGNYKVSVNSKHTQQYITWSKMLQRGYDDKYKDKYPTYKDVTVAEEWHNFQNFAKWFEENYYEIEGERMSIDKDILIKGNKQYSPETCVFVPQRINSLFIKRDASRGNLPIGVYFENSKSKYASMCSNERSKQTFLGYFNSPLLAFEKYKKYKEEVIKKIADEYKEKIPLNLYKSMVQYEVNISD